jgi:hypothetical protein
MLGYSAARNGPNALIGFTAGLMGGITGGLAAKMVGDSLNRAIDSSIDSAGYNASMSQIQVKGDSTDGLPDLPFAQRTLDRDEIESVLGPYRGAECGIYRNDEVIYSDTEMSGHGFLSGGLKSNFGPLGSALSGQGFEDSMTIDVYGQGSVPSSWQLLDYAPIGKAIGTGWPQYGWTVAPVGVAVQSQLTINAYWHFKLLSLP